jgi:hypothetical protein
MHSFNRYKHDFGDSVKCPPEIPLFTNFAETAWCCTKYYFHDFAVLADTRKYTQRKRYVKYYVKNTQYRPM